MHNLLYFFLILQLSCSSFSQGIERKIIIQNHQYYYTTINEQNQLATLHTGNVLEPLKDEKQFALPAGRNFNNPVVPFAWDIQKDVFYAVNFLNHPLNDRNEALKRFNLSSLIESNNKINAMELIQKSADENMFTTNVPYAAVLKKSNILSDFFYDAIAISDTSYFMAITNNSELYFWNYNGSNWKLLKTLTIEAKDFFTLFELNKTIYFVSSTGSISQFLSDSPNINSLKQINCELNSGILIINRDENTILFLKNNELESLQSLSKIISKKATKIF